MTEHLLRCFFYVMRWLPLSVLRFLATIFSIPLFLLLGKRRRVVWINLNRCFPTWSRRKRLWVCWRVFQKACQMFFDYSWLWFGTDQQFEKRVRYEGDLQHIASPKACLYFVPHFMGMACAGNWLGRRSVLPLHFMFRPQNNQGFNQLYKAGLTRFGQITLVDRQQGIAKLLQALKKNESVVILPDLDFGAHESEFVSFFGQVTATTPVLGRLAKISHAPIVPIIPVLHKKGYNLHILPEFKVLEGSKSHRDYALKMNQFLEIWVAKYPEQYWWLHRRFKTQPEGSAPIY